MDAITPDETSDEKKLTLIKVSTVTLQIYIIDDHYLFFVLFRFQFKQRIHDCKLIDQRDEFIQKWLVGKFQVIQHLFFWTLK